MSTPLERGLWWERPFTPEEWAETVVARDTTKDWGWPRWLARRRMRAEVAAIAARGRYWNEQLKGFRCLCGKRGTVEVQTGPSVRTSCDEHVGVQRWEHDDERCLTHDYPGGPGESSCLARPSTSRRRESRHMVDGSWVDVTAENEDRFWWTGHGWELRDA